MGPKYIFIVAISLSIAYGQLEYLGKKMGPYKFVIKQIEHCDDMGERKVYMHSTRIVKVARNKYIFPVNVTLLIPVDYSVKMLTECAIFGNGGWRPHFMVFEVESFCRSSKFYFPFIFNETVHAMGVEDCPVPPGEYSVGDFDLSAIQNMKGIPQFPYGHFRFDFNVISNGTLVGCERVYVDSEPVKKRRRKTQ